jgi:type I restriction enzyme, S subunit
LNDTLWNTDLPQNWKRQKLKYVARFIGGGTPDKTKSEFWNGDIPWVSPKDMKTEEVFGTEDHIIHQPAAKIG